MGDVAVVAPVESAASTRSVNWIPVVLGVVAVVAIGIIVAIAVSGPGH